MRYVTYFFYSSVILTLIFLCVNLFSYSRYDISMAKGDAPSNIVRNSSGSFEKLPFYMSLNNLSVEKYGSGKEKKLTVSVSLKYNDEVEDANFSLNHPYYYHQYGIYLFDFGKNKSGNDFVHLRITESRFRNCVFVGLVFTILSSFCFMAVSMIELAKRRGRWSFAVLMILLVGIVVAVMMKMNPMMCSAEVPPILRSVWFLPHVIAYILSYAVIIYTWLRSGVVMVRRTDNSATIALFETGVALYTIGLALGIVWAHFAWGTFWGWDIKETLALIMWGYSVLAMPMMRRLKDSRVVVFMLITVAVLLLLLCWIWPSLLHLGGMHSY